MPIATSTITVAQHREQVLAALSPLPAETLPLLSCLGLGAAEDVRSEVQLPRFDNSAMDGYAVRAADVAGAGPAHPVVLPVVGAIGAGQFRASELPPGTATKIMTGAPVPPGADAVVPYEWTDQGVDRVVIQQAATTGRNVRRAGEDVAVGDLVLSAGTRLGPRQLGLVAGVGRTHVTVHRRVRVAVLATGAELRPPGAPLEPGQIHESNSTLLAACVDRAGAVPVSVSVVGDEDDALLRALEDVAADLIVTSGGVSMGDHDVVKHALAPRGVWFGPVAMQPGKPQGFGLVGSRQVPLIAVPGNPVSVFVSFQQFVLPALRRLGGIRPETPAIEWAHLASPVRSPAGRRQFLRGARNDDGTVTAFGGHGSHLTGGLAQADCLVVVTEDDTALEAGARVEVIRIEEL
jgi:molybdopterin molybdotransferase